MKIEPNDPAGLLIGNLLGALSGIEKITDEVETQAPYLEGHSSVVAAAVAFQIRKTLDLLDSELAKLGWRTEADEPLTIRNLRHIVARGDAEFVLGERGPVAEVEE